MIATKDPFPILFISSWIGNLLLTLLAVFLALNHEGPLSPGVFLTMALCILSGNLLPIATYWIHARWNMARLAAEEAEASVHVRDALKRAEEVSRRLDEAEGALAKAVLSARQLPQRFKEQKEELEAVIARMEEVSFTVPQAVPALAGSEAGGDLESPSLSDRLDLLYETVEGLQETLDSTVLEILKRLEAPKPKKKAAKRPPRPETSPVDAGPDPDSAQPAEKESEPEPAAAQGELITEPGALNVPVEERSESTDASLRVHAMIGMNNRLFIRGDGPWLSWEEGKQMELVGIGEFAWKIPEDLTAPMEVDIYINDEQRVEGGPFTLQPAEYLKLNAKFDP
jgi:hypothetical protein